MSQLHPSMVDHVQFRKELKAQDAARYRDPDRDPILERVLVGYQWNAKRRHWTLLGFAHRATKVTAKALRRIGRRFKAKKADGPIYICTLRDAQRGHLPSEPPRATARYSTAPDVILDARHAEPVVSKKFKRKIRDRATHDADFVAIGQLHDGKTHALYLGPVKDQAEADALFAASWDVHVVDLREYKNLRKRLRKGRLIPGVTRFKRNIPV